MNNPPPAPGPAPPSASHQAGTTQAPMVTIVSTQAPPQFVNLGGAVTTNATGVGTRIVQGSVVATVASGQPTLQHLAGSINLTITNGSVNLRGAAGGNRIIRQEIRPALPGQTLIRANIGQGPLQRFPISVQTIQNPSATGTKINPIRLHPVGMNPLNLRLMPPVNLTGTTVKGTPNMVTLRPINQPMMHIPGGQQLQPGGVQRIPIFPLQATGKLPIAHLQPLTLRPAGATSQSTIHLTAIPAQAPHTVTSVMSSPQIGPISLVTGTGLLNKQGLSSVGVSTNTSPSVNSGPINLSTSAKYLKVSETATTPQFVVRQISSDQPLQLTTYKGDKDAKTGNVKESEQDQGEKPKLVLTTSTPLIEKSSVEDDSGSDKDSMSSEGSDSDDSNDENDSDQDEKNEGIGAQKLECEETDLTVTGSGDLEDDGLEWKDGIGTLPGSDLKFRKNEFGVLEMISEAIEMEDLDGGNKDIGSDNANVQSKKPKDNEDEESVNDVICCCESCGIHGLSQDFVSGGRFCSNRCVTTFASKQGVVGRKNPSDLSTMAAKRKKRKISDDSEDPAGLKVPRMRVDDDAMSTCSTESTPKKCINEDPVTMKSKTTVPPGGKRARSFSWQSYLEQENAVAAPNKLFKEYQDIPTERNMFKVGMRLEAIDPRHPSLYCFVSVVEVRGFRLRLHFDGYEGYDFWVNADSPFIFHVGWSEKNGKTLMPPKAYVGKKFDWVDYLKLQRTIAAPKSLFSTTSTAPVTPHGFRQGMKLEAVDKKNSNLICVATVAEVLGDNILIHFDGWENIYDYWCDPTSPYIHPVGWCQENNVPLSPPQDWKDIESFTWEEYLEIEKASPVPARAFKPRSPNNFEPGMRLEVVDRRNPILVRAATVVDTEAYSMTIHFDGWADMYDYSIDDDSPDMHPCGWCAKTGHPLTPPLTPKDLTVSKTEGCPTPGCTGVGHIKGSKYIGHHSAFGCPYTVTNLNKDNPLTDRMFLASLDYQYKKQKESESHMESSETPEKQPSPDVKKTPSKLDTGPEIAAYLLEAQRQGKPLYGRGSGRGRKKTIVKLMQEVEQLRVKTANATQLPHQQQQVHQQQSFQPLHTTPPILSPTTTIHYPLTNGVGVPLYGGFGPRGGNVPGPGGEGVASIHQSVFTPAQLTPHPYQDLPLGWEQNHAAVIPDLTKYRAETISTWDCQQVAEFVAKLPGCKDIAHILEEEQLDGESLLLLNQADMVRVLSIKLGPALKLHNTILTLKNNIDI